MDLLTYSSNDASPLNEARRQLWSSKYMLGCANREPHTYDKGFWMRKINEDRAELCKVARELRAKLPAKKVYRVKMSGEASELGFWVRAHTRGTASALAKVMHPHFNLESVEMINVPK